MYFDSQGGKAGSITITGTAMISYSSRRLKGSRSLRVIKEEFPFGLDVPLVVATDTPEVARIKSEERSVGNVLVLNFGKVAAAVAIISFVWL